MPLTNPLQVELEAHKIETFISIPSSDIMEFVPIRPRNYAPTRYFVTKWEHEQEKTAKKKRERRSEHDYKYSPQDFSSETIFLTCTRDRLYDILQKEAYNKPRYEE
jgi:hypothetical protein